MKRLVLGLLLFSSCASAPIQMNIANTATSQMNSLYNPFLEKAWCLNSSGVQNIIIGGPITCPMPLCARADIVMHSHPVFGEATANFLDWHVWGKYKEIYGNTTFGIMVGKDRFLFYER